MPIREWKRVIEVDCTERETVAVAQALFALAQGGSQNLLTQQLSALLVERRAVVATNRLMEYQQ